MPNYFAPPRGVYKGGRPDFRPGVGPRRTSAEGAVWRWGGASVMTKAMVSRSVPTPWPRPHVPCDPGLPRGGPVGGWTPPPAGIRKKSLAGDGAFLAAAGARRDGPDAAV